jgi:hypothetical protein
MGTNEMAVMNASAQPGGTAALPDVNLELHPYYLVQHLLDESADFQMMAVPDHSRWQNAWLTTDPNDYFGINCGYGIAVESNLHRFESVAQTPGSRRGIVAAQTGGADGYLRAHWLFTPDPPAWAPGQEPPPMIYDPWHSQRFTMPMCEVHIGESDGFHVYGVGRTFPLMGPTRQGLLVGGVGNVTSGYGRFQGHVGTMVFTGELLQDRGFLGNITVRVLDFAGTFRTDRELEAPRGIANPASNDTFLVMRLVKKDSHVLTTYGPSPGPNLVDLVTPSQIRSALFRFAHEHHRPRTTRREGQVIGNMVANVAFDLEAPPGTAANPVPFTTYEEYTFTDERGRTVGTVHTGIVDGISFGLHFPSLPNQPGVRFAGYGPIRSGTGLFEGVEGMLTVNSLIGISPHALSLIHVLHFTGPNVDFAMRCP